MVPSQCGGKEVNGGVVIATAGAIDRPSVGKLIFRVHYKTHGGSDVAWSYRVNLDLQPR